MTKRLHMKDLRNTSLPPIPVGQGAPERVVRPPKEPPAANAVHRRFNRTIGFWLGGVILGAGGCLLGASMRYEHPVGVAVSILWWGIYFGCFGMNVGALLGLWAER